MSDPAPDPPPAPDPARTVGVTPEEARRAAERVAPAPAPPVALPGYEILGELGRGGMGAVYKARQVALGREVAVKTILGDPADPLAAGRFLAEAVAVAAVNHPHVVQVFEFGTADGRPFLAMEYVPGDTLAARLRGGPLAPPAAAALVEKIARGVQAAHDRQIVHRDLKPTNVLLDARGEPKVTDFGLAKRPASDLTATRAVMGTPAYMAPEQARGGTKFVGPAADVYALGAILYECLTGRRPFDDPDALVLLRRVAEDEPVPPRTWVPAVPRDLERVCLKCLEKTPGRRYATAADLADDLRRVLAGEPVTARPPREWELAYQWARKRSLLIQLIAGLTAAAMCTCLTSVSVITTVGRAPDPAPAADARPADPPPPAEPAALVAGVLFAIGFVGTLALVIRPRRWVLLAVLAPTTAVLAGHALATGFADPGPPLAGLLLGVVLGVLVGLPARLVGRWLRADTTDVLIGGILGSAVGPVAASALVVPVVLARAPAGRVVEPDPLIMAAVTGGMAGGYVLGLLVGAWRSPTRRDLVRVERARGIKP